MFLYKAELTRIGMSSLCIISKYTAFVVKTVFFFELNLTFN